MREFADSAVRVGAVGVMMGGIGSASYEAEPAAYHAIDAEEAPGEQVTPDLYRDIFPKELRFELGDGRVFAWSQDDTLELPVDGEVWLNTEENRIEIPEHGVGTPEACPDWDGCWNFQEWKNIVFVAGHSAIGGEPQLIHQIDELMVGDRIVVTDEQDEEIEFEVVETGFYTRLNLWDQEGFSAPTLQIITSAR